MERDIVSLSALTLLTGLDEGMYTRSDVSDWVDARILESAGPSDALLELTLLSRKSIEEIVALLLVDGYQLAQDGVGTVEDVRRELEAFLEELGRNLV